MAQCCLAHVIEGFSRVLEAWKQEEMHDCWQVFYKKKKCLANIIKM